MEIELWSAITGHTVLMIMIALNSWVVHLLRKNKNKPNYERIILNLSLCDFSGAIVGLILLATITAATSLKMSVLLSIAWFITRIVQIYWGWVTLLLLMCISFDRFWAVAAPLHHFVKGTKKKLFIAMAVSWILPAFVAVTFVVNILRREFQIDELYELISNKKAKYDRAGAISVVVADLVFFAVYAAIIGKLYRNKAATKDYRHKKEGGLKNALVLCMGIVIVFIIAKTPYVVVQIIPWNPPNWLSNLAIIMYPVDHILNSVIYLLQKYRKKTSASLQNHGRVEKNEFNVKLAIISYNLV